MRCLIVIVSLCIFGLPSVQGGCPVDHILVGCNPSGISGTDDDMQLFFDVTQKYRTSDPDDMESQTWLNWYYPMDEPEGGWVPDYNLNMPGFDTLDDTIHKLKGGYELWIECVDISPDLEMYHPGQNTGQNISFTQPGDAFCYSCLADTHFHPTYRVPEAQADPNQTYWITFRVYDKNEIYQPSEPTTVVFMNAPPAGDLTLDGTVGLADLLFFMDYWLDYSDATLYNARGQAAYDLFERADINRDYAVDMADFAILARHWLKESEPDN